MIFLFDRLNDEIFDQANRIQEIISINKRWLIATVDHYLNEVEYYDNKLSCDLQYKISQMTPKKINTLSSNDKYNIVKPTLDLLTARITQCGTNEFRDHLCNQFEKNGVRQSDCETEREVVTDSPDDIKQESPATEAMFNGKEKLEKQQEMYISLEALEQEHKINLCDEHQEALSDLQLKREDAATVGEDPSLSKQKLVFNYLPVINPRGRLRDSDNIWKIYDSLSYPEESLVKFFQDILPNEEKVVLSFESVQQQVGSNDCGLFALAFATSLCYGDISSLLFYDQKSLRNHYVNCIENNEIQPFPSKPRRGSTRNNCKLVDLYLN
ncbi:unnamed protein product [Rotaria sp. Silwood2]|nr:unnamed protein product [Rotaria sp. Silwood2]CAF4561880.1 unnamed protein product [Rotaria sp. Silwood2]